MKLHDFMDVLVVKLRPLIAGEARRHVDELRAGLPVPRDGRDGTDADPEAIKRAVIESLPPPPRDGINGTAPTLEEVVETLRGDVNRAVQAWIESMPVPRDGRDGVDGAPGADGKSVDAAELRTELRAAVAESVDRAMTLIPKAVDGKDGRDGRDGRSIEPDEVRGWIEGSVGRMFDAWPKPRDGVDGKDGVSGRDGTGVDPDQVREWIETTVGRTFESWPKPRDGVDGRDGVPGRDGTGVDPDQVREWVEATVGRTFDSWPRPRDGVDGKDGRDGADGVSVEPDELRTWVEGTVARTFEAWPKPRDGVDGKDGAPGRDGASVAPEEVRSWVDGAVARTFEAWPKPVDGQPGSAGRDGRDGVDGTSVDPAEIRAWIDSVAATAASDSVTRLAADGTFTRAVADVVLREMPAPRDGADGADGRSIDTDAVREWVEATVTKQFEAMPRPRDGTDGRDGRDGADGKSIDPDEVRTWIDGAVQGISVEALQRVVAAGNAAAEAVAPDAIRRVAADVVAGLEPPRVDTAALVADIRTELKSDLPAMIQRAVRDAVAGLPMPKDGRDGRDGVDGKNLASPDAFLGSILPSIDPLQSYRAGTVAKHAGGVIQALRQTDPVNGELTAAGWSVLVRGFAGIEVDKASDRMLTMRVVGTDGMADEFSVPVPAVVYRGVFAVSTAYEPGDLVTHRGAIWHCNAPTSQTPGTGDHWTLSVKGAR